MLYTKLNSKPNKDLKHYLIVKLLEKPMIERWLLAWVIFEFSLGSTNNKSKTVRVYIKWKHTLCMAKEKIDWSDDLQNEENICKPLIW